MGRTNTHFRDVVGLIKDKLAQSRAAFFSDPTAAILRATAHSPPTPPDFSSLNRLGHCSRAGASPIIAHLMDRLHRTKNCVVALKCLLVVHHIIRRGPFILQDQLSIFPSAGGRNYLKLSGFRDGATVATWALSRWVRWYARYLETLISASRALGYFIGTTSSSSSHHENQQLIVSSISNADLIKEIDSLALVIEEISRLPDSSLVPQVGSDLLVKEMMVFVINDYLSCVNEVVVRLVEAGERLGCLSLSELSEMVCALRKLRSCRERLPAMKKPSIEMMWASVEGLLKERRDDSLYLRVPTQLGSRRVGPSESGRFVGRGESTLFQSERFESERFVGLDV